MADRRGRRTGAATVGEPAYAAVGPRVTADLNTAAPALLIYT